MLSRSVDDGLSDAFVDVCLLNVDELSNYMRVEKTDIVRNIKDNNWPQFRAVEPKNRSHLLTLVLAFILDHGHIRGATGGCEIYVCDLALGVHKLESRQATSSDS